MHPRATPMWLADLSAETIQHQPLPLRELLDEAVYYPAAGQDASAIRLLSNYLPNFVQMDYSVPAVEMYQTLTRPGCFWGYELVGLRHVMLVQTNQSQPVTATNWSGCAMSVSLS